MWALSKSSNHLGGLHSCFTNFCTGVLTVNLLLFLTIKDHDSFYSWAPGDIVLIIKRVLASYCTKSGLAKVLVARWPTHNSCRRLL